MGRPWIGNGKSYDFSAFDTEISWCNCIWYRVIKYISVYDTGHFYIRRHPTLQCAHCALVLRLNVKCSMSIKLTFWRSVPPEFLRSFFLFRSCQRWQTFSVCFDQIVYSKYQLLSTSWSILPAFGSTIDNRMIRASMIFLHKQQVMTN